METTRNFLDKARENLKAAELCAAQELYNACANRIYYAALHAAIAALAQRGIRIEKIDHKLVQSEFNGKFIYRQKAYPAKFRTYLPDMQALRNLGDYTSDNVSKTRASQQLAHLREMLQQIEQEVAA